MAKWPLTSLCGAIHWRWCSTASESTLNKLHFDLLLRRVCEDKFTTTKPLHEPSAYIFSRHTQENMSCKEPLSTRTKGRRDAEPGCARPGAGACYSSSLEPDLLKCFTTSTQFQPRGSSPLWSVLSASLRFWALESCSFLSFFLLDGAALGVSTEMILAIGVYKNRNRS